MSTRSSKIWSCSTVSGRTTEPFHWTVKPKFLWEANGYMRSKRLHTSLKFWEIIELLIVYCFIWLNIGIIMVSSFSYSLLRYRLLKIKQGVIVLLFMCDTGLYILILNIWSLSGKWTVSIETDFKQIERAVLQLVTFRSSCFICKLLLCWCSSAQNHTLYILSKERKIFLLVYC